MAVNKPILAHGPIWSSAKLALVSIFLGRYIGRMDDMSIAHKVCQARRRQGLTQPQLAEKAGVCMHTVWRLENRREVHLSSALRILEASGIAVVLTPTENNG